MIPHDDLRQKIEECLSEDDELPDSSFTALESLIHTERQKAVEELMEKAELIVDRDDGKYYWGFPDKDRSTPPTS